MTSRAYCFCFSDESRFENYCQGNIMAVRSCAAWVYCMVSTF